MRTLQLLAFSTPALAYLRDLPPDFAATQASWAWVSYSEPPVRAIQGSFNRSISWSPWNTTVSDPSLQAANQQLNETDFVAYDPKFFDLIGPEATITKVQNLSFSLHEASCYNPNTQELFFTEWGPPNLDPSAGSGEHSWQYLLNVRNNSLRNITTNPPLMNAHGCVFFNNTYYVVNDGSTNETAALYSINPDTLDRTLLLNNFYQQQFMGFNDLDIDPEGNFWISDTNGGGTFGFVPFAAPTLRTLYFINGTTMTPQPLFFSRDNPNGLAISRSASGQNTLYAAISRTFPSRDRALDAEQNIELLAFDYTSTSPILRNQRVLNRPISYFYDGVRVSRNGLIFGAAGDGVDVVDPETGVTLGKIRIGGGRYTAVNVAFGENEMWIVGTGGVWHVEGVRERLAREW